MNNKEHNETDFFFFLDQFFFLTGPADCHVSLWKASGKPFFFFLSTSWAYQIRNENSDAQKKQKMKQEARHNQT